MVTEQILLDHRPEYHIAIYRFLKDRHRSAQKWPWEDDSLSDMDMALRRLEAAFEFMTKLGVEYWCFHDRWVSYMDASYSDLQ